MEEMALRRLLGVFLLLSFWNEQVSSRPCPPRSQFNACTCSVLPNDNFIAYCNTISIENATQSILEVESIVQNLEQLVFLGAPDTEITRDSFLGLANITVLRITHSLIADIHPGAFNSLSQLQVLDLRNNRLTWLSADSFAGLNSSSLSQLYLDTNPLANLRSDLPPLFGSINQELSLTFITSLVCDCHLSWLRDFLVSNSVAVHTGTTCTSGISVTDTSVDFNQNTCLDICSLGYHSCASNATCSLVGDDITSCQCNQGFIGDGITCVDCPTCSPCLTTECGKNATCEEQDTMAMCTCDTGFTGDGYSCVSVTECEDVCPTSDDVYCIVSTSGDIMCASESVRELYDAFSEAEADPSQLPSFTEQLLNVSSNLTISDDIPQIITFLTDSLNLLNRIDDYQEDTYNNLVMVGSELLDLNNHHLWFELENVSRHVANLSLALYGLGREVLIKGNLSSSQNVTIVSNNIALVVVRPNCSEDTSNITVSSDILAQNVTERQSSLQLPSTIFGEEYECMEVAIIAVVYDNAGPLLSGEELIPSNNCTPTEAPLANGRCEWYQSVNCTTPQVNSVIISAFAVQHYNTTVNELDTSKLGDPIVITLQHNDITSTSDPTCVFVDDEDVRSGNGTWMTRQCEVVSHASSANMTVCQCFHLTSFALLTSPTGPPPPNLPLQIVSKIGLCISILCLLVVIILLFGLKMETKRLHHIHRQLALSLFLAQLVFLVFVDRTLVPIPDAACTLVAALLHYLFLCTFAWQLFEGLHLYIFIVKVFFNAEKLIWFYYPLAWGIPLIVVSITVGINFCDYGSEHYCWITTGRGTNWAFHGPVIVVLAFNILVLVVVTYIIARSARKKDTDTFLICTLFHASAVLLPVLGITWILGFFVVGESIYSQVVEWLFCIFTTLQGVMILIMHCLLNRNVRKAFLKAIGCHEAARRQDSTRIQLRRSSTVNSLQQLNNALKRRFSKTKTMTVDDITSYAVDEEFSSSFMVAKPANDSGRPRSAKPPSAVNPLHDIIEERESLPSSVAPSPLVNTGNHGNNITLKVQDSKSSLDTPIQSPSPTPQPVRTDTQPPTDT